MVKATYKDLLNAALPLQLLNSSEWDSLKGFIVNAKVTDEFMDVLKKLLVNQSRIECYQELLMGRFGTCNFLEKPINEGITETEIHLGDFIG